MAQLEISSGHFNQNMDAIIKHPITLLDVLARTSCSSMIFCTSPWKSLQVGHAEMEIKQNVVIITGKYSD